MTHRNCCVNDNSIENKHKTPLFYRLTHDEWVETVKNLTGAEIKVLYYLRSLDPFGVKRSSTEGNHHLEYSITEMAKELNISKGAASKAVKKLDHIGLIEAQISKVRIKITTDQYKDTEFPIGNKVSHSESQFPIGNEQQPEPMSDGDLRTPQTIKTYSDFIKTLSDFDRASFLNFCQEKAKNLSQEVIDLEAWLASKTKAGENRWEVQYRFYKASQSSRHQEELSRIQAREQVKKWKCKLEEQTVTATVACKESLLQEDDCHQNNSSSGNREN